VPQAAQHFILSDVEPERNARVAGNIRSLWGGEKCQILSCEHCGFGFSWPYAAGDSEFYNLAYRDANYPRMKWEYQRTLDALQGKDIKNSQVLEVGAGVGFFLDLLTAERVPAGAVTAIEYSDNARRALQEKGYASLATDIRATAFDDRGRSFDFIFIFQVVEHMDHLDALFQRLEYLLKPDGAIFVAVPNQVRTSYQETSGSLLDMPPNHIGRWTKKAFDAVAARAGLRVIAAEIEPFDTKSFILEDMSFSHLQRAQDPNSLAGKIRRLPEGRLRWCIEAALAVLWAPTRLPMWRRAFGNRENMGGSLWVHLERVA
jgi:SAM-dependent methyltransferase